jgi:hypothetical protein
MANYLSESNTIHTAKVKPRRSWGSDLLRAWPFALTLVAILIFGSVYLVPGAKKVSRMVEVRR